MQSVSSLRNTCQCNPVLSFGTQCTPSRVLNYLQERRITRRFQPKRGQFLRQFVSSVESYGSLDWSKIFGGSDAGLKTGSDFAPQGLLDSKDGRQSDATSAWISKATGSSTKSEQRAIRSYNARLQRSSDGSAIYPPQILPRQGNVADTAALHDTNLKPSMCILKVTSFVEALNALRFGDIELLDPATILAGWHHHNLNRHIQLSHRFSLSHDSFDQVLIYATLRPVIRVLKNHSKDDTVLNYVGVTYCRLSEAGQSLRRLAKAHSILSQRMVDPVVRSIVHIKSESQDNIAHLVLCRHAHDEAKSSDQSLKSLLQTKFPTLPAASMYNLGTMEPHIHIMQGALRAGSEASLFLEALDLAIHHRQALYNPYRPMAVVNDTSRFANHNLIRFQEKLRMRNQATLRDLKSIRTWLSNYALAIEQSTSNGTCRASLMSETSPAIALTASRPTVDAEQNGDATQSKSPMQTSSEFNVLPEVLRITIAKGFLEEAAFNHWVERTPSDLQTRYIRKALGFCRTIMTDVLKQDQSRNLVQSSSAVQSKQLELLRLVTNLTIITKYGRAITTTNTRATPRQSKLPPHLLPFCQGKLFPSNVKFATRSLPDHEKALVAFECIRILERHFEGVIAQTSWSRTHVTAIRTRIQQFTEWLRSIEAGKNFLVTGSEPEGPPNRFTGVSYDSLEMEINAVRTWYQEVEEEFKAFKGRLATIIPKSREYETMVYETDTLSLVLHAAAKHIHRLEFKARGTHQEPVGKLQLPFVPPVVPYDVLHYVFEDLLYQMQQAVFALGRRDFPDFMQEKGWLFPETVPIFALNEFFTLTRPARARWEFFTPELNSLRTMRNVYAHHYTDIDVNQLKNILEDLHIVALLLDPSLATHIEQHQSMLLEFEKKVAVEREVWRRACDAELKSIESEYSKARHVSVTKGKTLRQRRAEARTTKISSEERTSQITSVRDKWKEEDRNRTIACSSEFRAALLQKRMESMLQSLPADIARTIVRSMNKAYNKKAPLVHSATAEHRSLREPDSTRNESTAYITQRMPRDSKRVYHKPTSTNLGEGLTKEGPPHRYLDPSFQFLQANVLAGTETSPTVGDDARVALSHRNNHAERTLDSPNPARKKSSLHLNTFSPGASTYGDQKSANRDRSGNKARDLSTEEKHFIRENNETQLTHQVKPGLTRRIASKVRKNLRTGQAFRSRSSTRNPHYGPQTRNVWH